MTDNALFPLEGDFVCGTSSTFAFVITPPGAILVSSPACTLYKGTSDVSSTYLSGSASVNGTTITTQTIAITVADEYLLRITATVDGFVQEWYVKIIVKNPWDFL